MALAIATTLGVTTATLASASTLQSAGALAFDTGNVLFVGDTKAGVVRAFDFGEAGFDDQSDFTLGRAQTFEGRTLVNALDREIAVLLGGDADAIHINDMAVHKPSKQIVMSGNYLRP